MRYNVDSRAKTQPMRCIRAKAKRGLWRRIRYALRLMLRGGDPGDYQWTWGGVLRSISFVCWILLIFLEYGFNNARHACK